jgi:hypothetical protein
LRFEPTFPILCRPTSINAEYKAENFKLVEKNISFCKFFVSLRQNGVGTGFIVADAILPKGHVRTAVCDLLDYALAHVVSEWRKLA